MKISLTIFIFDFIDRVAVLLFMAGWVLLIAFQMESLWRLFNKLSPPQPQCPGKSYAWASPSGCARPHILDS